MRHLRFLLVILSVMVHISGVAYGEIYKWVDKNGITHFGDVPPQNAGTTSKLESMPVTQPKAAEPPVTPTEETQSRATNQPMKKAPPVESTAPVIADANVEMFATRWCGY